MSRFARETKVAVSLSKQEFGLHQKELNAAYQPPFSDQTLPRAQMASHCLTITAILSALTAAVFHLIRWMVI